MHVAFTHLQFIAAGPGAKPHRASHFYYPKTTTDADPAPPPSFLTDLVVLLPRAFVEWVPELQTLGLRTQIDFDLFVKCAAVAQQTQDLRYARRTTVCRALAQTQPRSQTHPKGSCQRLPWFEMQAIRVSPIHLANGVLWPLVASRPDGWGTNRAFKPREIGYHISMGLGMTSTLVQVKQNPINSKTKSK